MSLSLLKIISVDQDSSEGKATLKVLFIKNRPQVGEGIFLWERFGQVHFYEILQINSNTAEESFELIINSREEWVGGVRSLCTHDISNVYWNWILERIREQNDTAFCGLTIFDYHCLSTEDKIDYFKSVVQLLGNDKITPFIQSNIEPAIQFISKEFSDQQPDESDEEFEEDDSEFTKWGGLPNAPPGFCFPKDKNGKSALFIAQFHIEELNQYFEATKQLRGDGILYLFGTIRTKDEFTSFEEFIMVYSEYSVVMKKVELPEDLEEYGTFMEFGKVPVEVITIPSYDSSLWRAGQMNKEEMDSYFDILNLLDRYNFFEGPRLLGHANNVQGCVLFESELKRSKLAWYNPQGYNSNDFDGFKARSLPAILQWRLLFEIDPFDKYFRELSDFRGTFNEYVDGKYYLMIRQSDLDNMEFSETETIYQST